MSTQETRYPDPAQLRKWADEPYPFDDVLPSDLELQDDERLTATVHGTEYVYAPAYITIETKRDEWERQSDVPWATETHTQAWRSSSLITVEEDYITARYLYQRNSGETFQVEAYWLLDTITVHNPDTP